jgi:hypothetical protein
MSRTEPAPAAPDPGGDASPARRALRRALSGAARAAVTAGLPPALAGWRHVRRAHPADRLRAAGQGGRIETVHPERVAENPLPRGVSDPGDLNPDPVWFGFAFRDVPRRRMRPTRLLPVGPARAIGYGGPGRAEEYHPAVLAPDGTSLELDQIVFRHPHAALLRARPRPQRLPRAVWILERVWHNHSHWLTAHLPKVLLARDRGLLPDLVLPDRLPGAVEASLRGLGVDPDAQPRLDLSRPLETDDLVLIETDRFRPELLRPVRAALTPQDAAPPHRRVFISREGARARRLRGEAALRPALEARGFEFVRMEDLDFPAQIRLMAETAVLAAPHGAGLTNMLFCREGAQVLEIADPAYPNPNFYALACAMGLGYGSVPARSVGEGHILFRDLEADPEAVLAAVDATLAEAPA